MATSARVEAIERAKGYNKLLRLQVADLKAASMFDKASYAEKALSTALMIIDNLITIASETENGK